ncbi:YjeF N-terminal domain-containing protein [Geopyxis carbonaria]|nr:YjeF N-terminal domain-containing protein [Geopyxis carbonaria]
MALRTISAKAAAEIDKDLMSSGAFSIDQLMELAGLAVSQAVYRVHPPHKGRNVLIACGPGNNGGDGLVAARHLWHFSYKPCIYYPKQPSGPNGLYTRLLTQCRALNIPVVTDFPAALASADHVVDAIFGFSFSGEVREPFPAIIAALAERRQGLGVTSVDAPSGWDIETGPPSEGCASAFMPNVLVSLTAPKPLAAFVRGRHFVGGRFVPLDIRERYGVQVPDYEGVDQVVEVPVEGRSY